MLRDFTIHLMKECTYSAFPSTLYAFTRRQEEVMNCNKTAPSANISASLWRKKLKLSTDA
jgi:hypothetical protein